MNRLFTRVSHLQQHQPAVPFRRASTQSRELRAQRLTARLSGPTGVNTSLVLWKPGTRSVEDLRAQKFRAAQSAKPGSVEQVAYKADAAGWYFLEVKVTTPASGAYTLSFAKG